jgi:hypothetical protein
METEEEEGEAPVDMALLAMVDRIDADVLALLALLAAQGADPYALHATQGIVALLRSLRVGLGLRRGFDARERGEG